jgi:CRISPR type IV-associated protein Csf2
MKTYVLEGICTALSSICHNGGEKNGTIIQLRREKVVQPNGKIVEIPVISGNSIRGKIRDLAAIDILTKKDGVKVQVDADSFNLLFSGGSLESVGDKNLDIEMVRKMREDIPMISVLGCSVGNIILPGKVDIGKMIPICKETLHLIPEKFHGDGEKKTIWEYCQVEMNTRKDDTKDENKREYIKPEDINSELSGGQMMYYTETFIAETKFY